MLLSDVHRVPPVAVSPIRPSNVPICDPMLAPTTVTLMAEVAARLALTTDDTINNPSAPSTVFTLVRLPCFRATVATQRCRTPPSDSVNRSVKQLSDTHPVPIARVPDTRTLPL
mmetsp:Transcript_9558/g.22162  ORF Transcript_9558/g.22162 Transcript_9558/m.22162 type:complete len:114 (-) Transcript_9558:241-582(-)